MAALGPVLPCPFGRYTLVERVGAGGMATVYRALLGGEGGFEKEVAVKVVREELASEPQFRTLFLDEARVSARLSHANLVQTFDFGQVDGTWFLAMEFVRGRTLANLLRALRTKGLWPGTPRSLQIAAEVARGLGHAHRLAEPDGTPLGLVHRDVSPQNVLVSAEGEVKLGDFGIAKAALCSHVTQPGKVRGKCAYMAPEQARGHAVDARADVFALGVVLWECLTGTALFDGNSDLEILRQVLQKEVAPPSRLRAEVPAEVDALVLRMLARDAAARPANGDAAALELEALKLRFARDRTDLDLRELDRQLRSGTAVQVPAAVAGPPAAARPMAAEASLDLSIAVTGAGEGTGASPVAASPPADTEPVPGRSASADTAPARPGSATGTTVTLRSAGSTARPAPASTSTQPSRARWRSVGLVALSLVLGAGLGLLALGLLPLRPPAAGAAPAPAAAPALAPARETAGRTNDREPAVPRGDVEAPEPVSAASGATPAPVAALPAAPPPEPVLADESASTAPTTTRAARPLARTRAGLAVASPRAARGHAESPGESTTAPVAPAIPAGGTPAPSEGPAAPAERTAGPSEGPAAPASPPPASVRPANDSAPRGAAPANDAELVVSTLLAADAPYVRIDGGPARPLPARTPITLRLGAGRRRIVFGAAGRACPVAVELVAGKNPALHQGEDGVVRRLDGTRKLALACE